MSKWLSDSKQFHFFYQTLTTGKEIRETMETVFKLQNMKDYWWCPPLKNTVRMKNYRKKGPLHILLVFDKKRSLQSHIMWLKSEKTHWPKTEIFYDENGSKPVLFESPKKVEIVAWCTRSKEAGEASWSKMLNVSPVKHAFVWNKDHLCKKFCHMIQKLGFKPVYSFHTVKSRRPLLFTN